MLATLDDRVNHKVTQGIKKAMEVVIDNLDNHIQSKLRLIIKDEVRRHHYSLGCCDMKLARAIANQEIDKKIKMLTDAHKGEQTGHKGGAKLAEQKKEEINKLKLRESYVSESLTYNVSQEDLNEQ